MKLFYLLLSVLLLPVLSVTASAGDSIPAESNRVRRATVEIEVSKYKKAKAAIDSIVLSNAGYIAFEQEGDYKTKVHSTFEIRILNAHFVSALNAIMNQASKVISKDVRVVDLEKEQEALKKQIESKTEVKNRYHELVSKSKLVDEIKRTEEKITEISAEIKHLEESLNALNDTRYSSLFLDMTQHYDKAVQIPNADSSLDLRKESMSRMLRMFFYFTVLPLVVVIVAHTLYRRFRRDQRRKRREKQGHKSPW